MNAEQLETDGAKRAPSGGKIAAIFLDRDGVIIANRANYVRDWRDVAIYPQALAALARLQGWPGKVVIVTNQSVVGRGLIALQTAEEINRRLVQVIRSAGGRVDAVYMCPHAPTENCQCRKPRPGLLVRAAQNLGLDVRLSMMIGDALSDISAGRAAGIAQVALVQTGRGRQQMQSPAAAEMAPFPVFATLADALQQLVPTKLSHHSRHPDS